MPDFLHNRRDFPQLLRIVAEERNILPALIEKDYWIMHTLYGLQCNGFEFELKGGTSLSKGFGIIHRFSEDIDIHIKPRPERHVVGNPKNVKPSAVKSRHDYYDWLARNIVIDGISGIVRDVEFDDTRYYRSGGIRLNYRSHSGSLDGLKDGILLEAGFAKVTPNRGSDISSWAYEKAVASGVDCTDNRALGVACYEPGYTLVEKLQTITTKFRYEQHHGVELPNLMRQYYDVASLLADPDVQAFVGSDAYHGHKAAHFSNADLETPIAENQAFLLQDPAMRERFRGRYLRTASLYYQGQPDFQLLLDTVAQWLPKL